VRGQERPHRVVPRALGTQRDGRCTTSPKFPAHYRHGVFIAFHGSWDRAPYAQGGYNVVFQGLAGDHASGQCEVFADGFAGAAESPDQAAHRPSGVAVGPTAHSTSPMTCADGSYRIVYRGGSRRRGAPRQPTPCPSAAAPAGNVSCRRRQTTGRHSSRCRRRRCNREPSRSGGRDEGDGRAG